MKNYLNFENEIKELETELEALKDPYNKGGISEVNTNEIMSFENKINTKLEKIYSRLDPWQTTQVARHGKLMSFSTLANKVIEYRPLYTFTNAQYSTQSN